MSSDFFFKVFFLCNDKKVVQRDRDKFTQLGVFDSPVVPMPMNPFLEGERESSVFNFAGVGRCHSSSDDSGYYSPTNYRQNLTGVSSAPVSQEN